MKTRPIFRKVGTLKSGEDVYSSSRSGSAVERDHEYLTEPTPLEMLEITGLSPFAGADLAASRQIKQPARQMYHGISLFRCRQD